MAGHQQEFQGGALSLIIGEDRAFIAKMLFNPKQYLSNKYIRLEN